MSDKIHPPITELQKFVSKLIDDWAEARTAADASVLKKAEAAKQATVVKGQATKKKKQLGEFIKKFEQPSLPGMGDEPEAGPKPPFRAAVLMVDPIGTNTVQGVELYDADSRQWPVEYGLDYPPVTSLSTAIGVTGTETFRAEGKGPPNAIDVPKGATEEEAKAILKAADRIAPGAPLADAVSSLMAAEAGPVDLVVAVAQSTRKATNAKNHGKVTELVGTEVTKLIVESVTAGDPPAAAVCDLLHYRFEDHMAAQAAADKVEGAALSFVVGVTIDTAEDPPSGPAEEPIELEVIVKSLGVRLAVQLDDVEKAVGAKPAEFQANEDETGATLWFDFATIRAAFAAEDRVKKACNGLLEDTFVSDPKESRFSEAELDRLDAAPRRLETYAPKSLTETHPTCTRCVALGHVFPGDEKINAGLPPDADCYFCGWKPAK